MSRRRVRIFRRGTQAPPYGAGALSPRAMHAASALSYTGAGEGYTVRRCGGGSWFLGICALGLGLGILIAAVFPVGCLMFLVAFLLIACGVACLRDRR